MKPTLLVLAAGMGSRFGGLKQMEPVGPSGEWILDYSVHDALRAGFDKVVFVIRKEMEDDFKRITEAKYGDRIALRYAFQQLEDVPLPGLATSHRQKPWGTGHAVYAARSELDAPFAVINADDFYGAEAFATLSRFLSDQALQAQGETCALVGYKLRNTLSKHGAVSRGICRTTARGELVSVEEHAEIRTTGDGRIHGLNSGGEKVQLEPETMVSLNCWGFPQGWADRLEEPFRRFLKSRGEEAKSEFYLPAAVDAFINEGASRALTLPCEARWLGVTHREDLPIVKSEIANLVENGDYPSPL